MRRCILLHRPATAWLAVGLLVTALAGAAPAQVIVTNPNNPIVGIVATPGSATSTAGTVGTTPNVNNWPAAESPPNAIDNNTATKYLNFAKTNTGFIVTPSAMSVLTSFQLFTANDSPERDPTTVSIEGTNSPNATTTLNSTWTSIYNGVSGLATDPGRLTAGPVISFANALPFASYRVLVTGVRDATAANSMQLSEFHLLSPVPEPSSLALGSLAVAGFGFWRRKRRAAA